MGGSARLLYICDFNAHGGTQTHLLHLLDGLDRTQYRPALAALTLHPELARRLAGLDVEVIDLRLKGAFRASTLRTALSLAARARRGADLLHGFLYTGNILAALVSVASGVPCLTSVRNMDIRKRGRHRLMSGLAHRRARCVVFNSRTVRDATLGRERIPAARAVVIPNGVADPAQGAAPPDRTQEGRPPVVICVASLRAKKGHRHLLEAFSRLRRRHPDARLLLVGEGPERDGIEAAIRAGGLEDAVELAGYRPDAVALMKSADLFVLSSLEEGMPNALLEAMGAGLPGVVTRVGGNAEVVVDGSTGFLVPPADPAAMAERMEAILADPALRRRMGEAARRRFEARYTLPAMIAAYEALYQRMLGPAEARP